MFVTKEYIIEQLNGLEEQLDTINALGTARAAEKYQEDTEEDEEARYRILNKSKKIADLQHRIDNARDALEKNNDSKSKGFRVIKYKVEHFRLEALELFEEILELDADIDLDNTELDPEEVFGPDEEEINNTEEGEE